MKNLAIFILLVVFVTENIFSYDQKTKTINYNIKRNVSEEQTGPPNFLRYEFNADHDIGYWVSEETEYLSGYSFPLADLPPEEYIISCKLEIIFDEIYGSAFRAYVKELPNTAFSNDASEVFEEIKYADDFFYFDYPDTADRDITSKVIENISTGFIKFGLTPINQYQYTNLAEIKSIKIIVKYNDYSEIVVKNKMDSFDGGNVGVGINEATTSVPSPNSFSTWNDTEGSLNKSQWEKKISQNSWLLSDDQSTTYTVESSEDEVNLIANLKKYYKIDRKDDCSEFDNLINNSGVTYIVEQNSDTITAPPTKPVN